MWKETLNSENDLVPYVERFLERFPKGGFFGLSGNLGAGKTQFVRSVIRKIAGTDVRVMSPTYVFHQTYRLSIPVDHFDLYRLENADESTLQEIGYDSVVERHRAEPGFLFIEWPEKALEGLLDLDYRIQITPDGLKRDFQIETWQASAL